MGELVVSCEDSMDVEMEKKEERESEEMREKEGGSSSMVRWERFLPSIALRVLLVEADDSTRHIIGALLRKCNYKVASVPDGLKAWEVLKARPHNIDLILTEVELPSISGYALLTLIMEHEICKNIPVIMMSTHDPISTVYKCMLRGAADFLVKPIRINELKNLWQHVWRRQSMRRQGLGPQDESVAEEKLEATAENNATSDHSSNSKICSPRLEECIKKGSDAQSSCGKLDLEAEIGYMAEVENHSLENQTKSPVSNSGKPEHSNSANSSQNLCTPESAVADGRSEQRGCVENVNPCTETTNNSDVYVNSSSEAIDLIGALRNYSRPYPCVNDRASKFGSSLELDLSLRRSHSDVHENKTTCEKQMLNHSNASAFTRYVSKPLHISNANTTYGPTLKGDNTNAEDSSHPYDTKVISVPMNITEEVEHEYQTASQILFPTPFPVRGIQMDVCATPTGYGASSPSPSPSSTNKQTNSFHQFSVDVVNGRQHYHAIDQSPGISSNNSINNQDLKFESVVDQSASSRLCNGNAGYQNGFGCGTMGGSVWNVHQDAVVPGGAEIGTEQSHVVNHGLNRQRSIQREAALTKFRLKRKERCFEKKVRYESRKKLAEQRPRVKGQFVRQVPPI